MKDQKVNIENLMTIKNYADREGVTASYIYKLERDGKMKLFTIDGVKFVQTDVFTTIPIANRRK